jgi:hypothetical protein
VKNAIARHSKAPRRSPTATQTTDDHGGEDV